jgi:hypothetical protein
MWTGECSSSGSCAHRGLSKSDPQARPVYHCKRDSIEAHLTIVCAALAVSRWIEERTGWSIRKLVKTVAHLTERQWMYLNLR